MAIRETGGGDRNGSSGTLSLLLPVVNRSEPSRDRGPQAAPPIPTRATIDKWCAPTVWSHRRFARRRGDSDRGSCGVKGTSEPLTPWGGR